MCERVYVHVCMWVRDPSLVDEEGYCIHTRRLLLGYMEEIVSMEERERVCVCVCANACVHVC
jgi:hypothetical protein